MSYGSESVETIAGQDAMFRFMQVAVVIAIAALPARTLQAAPVASAAAGDARVVVYPSSGRDNDSRGNYYVSLLKLALARSDATFDVQPSKQATVTLRALAAMAEGHGIDVIWAPNVTTIGPEFLPVRIPVDHGILGWRIFLIDKRDSDTFASVRSLDQLKAWPAGQVAEWADTTIMRANGIPVVEATLYESLFPMLAAHRFRYLPRGIGEIEGEARNYASLGLAVESHLAFHYPYCTYFYVSRSNGELAHQIEIGLRRMQKDGSLEALFQKFNGPAIQRAELGRRTVFELTNPLIGPDGASAKDRCVDSGNAIFHAN